MGIQTIKVCVACYEKRNPGSKPGKITLGRQCHDCKKDGRNITLVPLDIEVKKSYEQGGTDDSRSTDISG